MLDTTKALQTAINALDALTLDGVKAADVKALCKLSDLLEHWATWCCMSWPIVMRKT